MDASAKKQWRWSFLPLALLVATGCHTTQPITTEEFTAAPVHQVHVTWSNKVAVTTDVGTNAGADLPGIVGRLYLMGSDLGHTVKSNGRVVVDLYEAAPKAEPKFLGRWQISKENLAHFGQKDIIGLGYTLFLPLPPDFQTDNRKFQLQVSYLPDEGSPMYAARSSLTLSNDSFAAIARIRPQPLGQEQPVVTTVADQPAETPVSPGTVPVNHQESH